VSLSLFTVNFNRLGIYRHRLASGGSEKIQLTALLGAFKNAVELTARSA
jgi:replication factor C subunit 3/5